MTQLINARAWLRDLPGWPEDDQEEEVRAWCREHGFKLVVYRASTFDRDTYVKAIRDTEAAVLPRLDIIISPKRQGKMKPSHEFTQVLDKIRGRAWIVVDVWHAARSDAGKSWGNALAAALRRVSSGRTALPPAKARDMQKASVRARSSKSPLAKWRGLKERNHKDYRMARAIWKSREFANAAEAQKALPEELHGVSKVSLDRLFEGRTKRAK